MTDIREFATWTDGEMQVRKWVQLEEYEAVRAEYAAYRADGEPELRAANAEIERLRELLGTFEELLALDPENRPGTDLYNVMLQTGLVLRPEPQPGEHD